MIGVRLQGGPFDGDRARSPELRLSDPPERIYALPCPCAARCGETQLT